jgi:hypothetical protein
MSDNYNRRKLFLIAILAAAILVVGSNRFVQTSLAQGLIRQGQLAGFSATSNQTENQSALLGDPAKMYVPSQPED